VVSRRPSSPSARSTWYVCLILRLRAQHPRGRERLHLFLRCRRPWENAKVARLQFCDAVARFTNPASDPIWDVAEQSECSGGVAIRLRILKAVRSSCYPCQTCFPQQHGTVSVGRCLINCFLQMGHGLAITFVHGLTPRLNRSMAGAGYKFIVSSGM
jgi:hypothetical protein